MCLKRNKKSCNLQPISVSRSLQCRPHLLPVKFGNLVHNIFRNENSTLKINVSHFGVLPWQQWQPLASAPIARVDLQKKLHSLGVSFFGHGIFKGCYTLLWNHNCNEHQFFQNFQDKLGNFTGVFTKTFPQPLCLFLFPGTYH